MLTVPAFVWQGGRVRQGAIIGGVVGVCLGAMAWLDSGMLPGGVIALVVTGFVYGIWMPRRMARFWPRANRLSGEERVAVVRTARRGERIGDAGLAQAVIDYGKGVHAAAEMGRPFRWVMPLVLVVGIGLTVWDAIFGSWGNAVASAIYVVALLVELLWWPRRREELLANADRAAGLAGQLKTSD